MTSHVYEPLPKLFAVKRGPTFSVYQNRTFKSAETNNFLVNVVSKTSGLSIEKVRRYAGCDSEWTAYIRKSAGGAYNRCSWGYGSIEVEVKDNLSNELTLVPLVVIDNCSENILPIGSDDLKAKDATQYYRTAEVAYAAADFYITEPYAEGSAPVPTAPAQPVAVAEVPVVYAIPSHVKCLIIADSISRKESCPISSADITKDNAAVTSCGHVFEAKSIKTWLGLASSKSCCPICKQKCCV